MLRPAHNIRYHIAALNHPEPEVDTLPPSWAERQIQCTGHDPLTCINCQRLMSLVGIVFGK